MINIKTVDELYEFSVRNSTEFRLNAPDRDKDVTILFYDTNHSNHDKCYKIEGCDVTFRLPEKRPTAIQVIQDMHFIGCNIKNIGGLKNIKFLRCCFVNCEIEDDNGSDFLECLIYDTLIKSSSTFERIFKYKACILDKVTFSGFKWWIYDRGGNNLNYGAHFSYWNLTFWGMKSCSMIIDGKPKEIDRISILEQKNNTDISMIYFVDKSAIFAAPSVTLNVTNIDDLYFYGTKTYFFKKISFLQSIADSFNVDKVDVTEDASLVSEVTKCKTEANKYIFEQWDNGCVISLNVPCEEVSHQNKFKAIEYLLRNKLKPDDNIKKDKSMIRTVVLYSNREYWVDKSITGYSNVRIDAIYGNNANSRLKAVTQEGFYIRDYGFVSIKEFCNKIGIHVNDDDNIILENYKLLDATVLSGNFNDGYRLVQEYYGEYKGRVGEEFTYTPVCG